MTRQPGAQHSALRHGASAHNTALAAPTIRRPAPVTRLGSWPQHGHARVCLGAPGALAGPVWVFYAPDSVFDLVFDSVLFLSHRLDPVHEHCS